MSLDLNYIKENFGIDPAVTSQSKALKVLREHEISTTSWVLSDLESVYGKKFGDKYRKSIASETCEHGFIGECVYCKWGTE